MDPSIFFNPEFDGTDFTIPGSSTGMLLFHGFTATTLEVREFAEKIHTQYGFTIHAPLLPGHGTSPQDLAKTNYKDWLKKADNTYKEFHERQKEVIVAGESMGGLLSLFLLSEYPEISSAIVFAPALIIRKIPFVYALQHFLFSTPKKLRPTPPGYLPWQGYKVNPLKAVAQLGKLQKYVKKRLPVITQPVLAFQGLEDETIDIQSSRVVINSIRSKVKELIEIENGQHCVLLDAKREAVYAKTIEFIATAKN